MSRYIIRPTSVGALARGADYKVTDLGASPEGYTKLVEKELGVSLDAGSGETRWTQLHELSHVRHSLYTPEKIRRYAKKKLGIDLPVETILAAEDARINELLTRRVPDAHAGFKLKGSTPLRYDLGGYVASHASPKSVKEKIRKAVAAGTPAETLAKVDAFLSKLETCSDRALTVLRATLPLARLMADAAKPKDEPRPESGDSDESDSGKPEPGDSEPETGDGGGGDSEPADSDSDEPGDSGTADGDKPEPGDGDSDGDSDEDGPVEPEDGDSDEDAEDETGEDREALGAPDRKPGKTCAHAHGSGDKGEDNSWTIPEVCEPELTEVSSRAANTAVTTSESGSSLRWAHLYRLHTDGVVFRKLKRRPGAIQRGTILIDASGSMSLDSEAIDGLLAILPYATVAMYSGHSYRKGPYGPHSGWIVVLARNGRRVASVASCPRGIGNMVDGPALLWLSRQPGPRLWLCDGTVTVGPDMPSSAARQECDALMRAAGIVQVCGMGDEMRASRTLREGYMSGVDLTAFARVMRDLERGIVGE